MSVHKCFSALVQQFLYSEVTVCSPPDKRDILVAKEKQKRCWINQNITAASPLRGIFESWLVLGQTLHTTVSWEGVTSKTSSTALKSPALENIWSYQLSLRPLRPAWHSVIPQHHCHPSELQYKVWPCTKTSLHWRLHHLQQFEGCRQGTNNFNSAADYSQGWPWWVCCLLLTHCCPPKSAKSKEHPPSTHGWSCDLVSWHPALQFGINQGITAPVSAALPGTTEPGPAPAIDRHKNQIKRNPLSHTTKC